MVGLTGSDEIISGKFHLPNFRGNHVPATVCGKRPAALVLDVTAFSRAPARNPITRAAGRRKQPGRAAWVSWGVIIPALAGIGKTFMVYKCNYELFIQF